MYGLLVIVGCLVGQSYSVVNKVVDLSHWNKANLSLAMEDGILAVIHKATQGRTYVDPNYEERRDEAESVGLLWGAYHFGVGGLSGIQQADHFLNTVDNFTNVLLVLDIEPNGKNTMSLGQAEEFVLHTVDRAHRYPLIYGSSYFLSEYIAQSSILKKCKLWVAHYTMNESPRLPRGSSSWLFWQYTDGSRGGTPRTVNGIGPCDRDRFNGDEEELLNKWPNF